MEIIFPKLGFTSVSLIGTLVALSSTAQAQQARVSGATVIDDGNTISTLAGEVELAPGQLLDDNGTDPVLTVESNILSLPNTSILRGLSLDFEIENNRINFLENSIANAVENANFDNASDVISLVEAFGTGIGNGEQRQARVTGAGGFDTGDVLTAIAATAELAPSQQLTNETVTIAAVEPGGISLDFGIDNNNTTRLEEVVVDAVETVFLDPSNGLANNIGVSDVISLVEAFQGSNFEQEQARVAAALTLDNDTTISAIASEAELAPGQLLEADGAVQPFTGENLTVVVQSETQNLVTTGLSLDFGIANSGGSAIERAIADTVNATDIASESNAVSLVKAFLGSDNEDPIILDQLGQSNISLD